MELCLVVAEQTTEAVRSIMERFGRFAHSFEIRADFLERSETGSLGTIRKLTPKKLILTARKPVDGGRWTAPESFRRELYERALDCGYDFVDLETDALPGFHGNERTRVIRSFHDMKGMPPDLLDRYARTAENPEEIPKISVYLKTSEDVLAFLAWNRIVRESGNRKRIVMAMGPKGSFSRVLGEKLGSKHTYAPAPGRPLLPGMVDIDRLYNLYRAHAVTTETPVWGIVDPSSSYAPPDTGLLRDTRPGPDGAVRVPFILDSAEEAGRLQEFFGVERFYRLAD